MHGLAPPYISDLLKLSQPVRVTRSSQTNAIVLEPRPTKLKTFAARSFSAMAPAEWNKLPAEIRIAESVDTFRKQLKPYLFARAFKDFI